MTEREIDHHGYIGETPGATDGAGNYRNPKIAHLFAALREIAEDLTASEKRAEEAEAGMKLQGSQIAALVSTIKNERDDARAELSTALWREMKDAPEIEGAEIIACSIKQGDRPCKFVWKEKPHVVGGAEFPVEVGWYAKGEPIMIRRAYQDEYVWVPLPSRSALHRSGQ